MNLDWASPRDGSGIRKLSVGLTTILNNLIDWVRTKTVQAVKAIYDGVNVLPVLTIPISKKCEVMIVYPNQAKPLKL